MALLEGTLSDQAVYDNRTCVCDLGYLREVYRTGNALESLTLFMPPGGTNYTAADVVARQLGGGPTRP